MDYPSGHWEYCSCGGTYFLYDDGVGGCSACHDKRMKAEDKRERKMKRLERENKRLKKNTRGKR